MQRVNVRFPHALAASALLVSACCTPTPVEAPVPPEPPPTLTPPPATYDVHEWGLVRATVDDRVMLSGPPAPAPVFGLGKPVLYFHRVGVGALEVDVSVHIEGGRIVEHWPLDPAQGEPGGDIAWHVQLDDQTCTGTRYPNAYGEQPCERLATADGCEAATLRTVETTDATCLTWTQGAASTTWNHLFYRAELQRDPLLPLIVEPSTAGAIRLSSRGTDAIGGSILRVVRGHGAPGIRDSAIVLRAPQHGETIDVPAPTGSIADAMAALDASLREAGLTEQETAAFRRAWDETLFGTPTDAVGAGEARGGGTGGLAGGHVAHPTDSLLYVLPQAAAESLATLQLTPAPRELRRVIVAWVDVPASS